MSEGYLGPACKIHGPHCGHSDNSCPDNPDKAANDLVVKAEAEDLTREHNAEAGIALAFAARMQGWTELANEAWKRDPNSQFSKHVDSWRIRMTNPYNHAGSTEFPTKDHIYGAWLHFAKDRNVKNFNPSRSNSSRLCRVVESVRAIPRPLAAG